MDRIHGESGPSTAWAQPTSAFVANPFQARDQVQHAGHARLREFGRRVERGQIQVRRPAAMGEMMADGWRDKGRR
jgi:hypothetical protein